MSNNKHFFILIIFLSLNVTISEAQLNKNFKKEITSSIEIKSIGNNKTSKHIINSTFNLSSFIIKNELENVLYEQIIDKTIISGIEGSKSLIKVKAWRGANFSELLWELNDSGDDAELFSTNFYKIIKFGYSGSEETYSYYNTRTGEKIVTTTSGLYLIEAPNLKTKRLISYFSSNSAINTSKNKVENLIGIIQYSDQYQLLKELNVIADLGGLSWTPQISLCDNKKIGKDKLTEWTSKSSSLNETFSNFSVKLTFQKDMEIIIPISNDDFDLDNLKLNSNLPIKLMRSGNLK
jgi:hypothetical protein